MVEVYISFEDKQYGYSLPQTGQVSESSRLVTLADSELETLESLKARKGDDLQIALAGLWLEAEKPLKQTCS